MSTGSGVVLIVIGAIIYWADGVNVPYVNDKTLGGILMMLGAVALAVSLAMHMQRSTTTVGTGVGLVLAGAICRWGLAVNPSWVNLDGLGLVLIVAGLVAIVATVVMEKQRTNTRRVVQYRSPGQDRYGQQYQDNRYGQQYPQDQYGQQYPQDRYGQQYPAGPRRLPAQLRRFWN